MRQRTPDARAATRSCRLRDLLEHLIFDQSDLDALARGWEVHQPSPYRRVYRDPRWNARGVGGGRGALRCAGAAVVR